MHSYVLCVHGVPHLRRTRSGHLKLTCGVVLAALVQRAQQDWDGWPQRLSCAAAPVDPWHCIPYHAPTHACLEYPPSASCAIWHVATPHVQHCRHSEMPFVLQIISKSTHPIQLYTRCPSQHYGSSNNLHQVRVCGRPRQALEGTKRLGMKQ